MWECLYIPTFEKGTCIFIYVVNFETHVFLQFCFYFLLFQKYWMTTRWSACHLVKTQHFYGQIPSYIWLETHEINWNFTISLWGLIWKTPYSPPNTLYRARRLLWICVKSKLFSPANRLLTEAWKVTYERPSTTTYFFTQNDQLAT